MGSVRAGSLLPAGRCAGGDRRRRLSLHLLLTAACCCVVQSGVSRVDGSASGASNARHTLVFDGDCGFCSQCARFAARRLPTGVDVIAWQEVPRLADYGLTMDQVERGVCWVDRSGVVWDRHRGVARILVAMGRGWAVLGMVMDLPGLRIAAAVGYRLVARYRHLLPGGTPACRVAGRSSTARAEHETGGGAGRIP